MLSRSKSKTIAKENYRFNKNIINLFLFPGIALVCFYFVIQQVSNKLPDLAEHQSMRPVVIDLVGENQIKVKNRDVNIQFKQDELMLRERRVPLAMTVNASTGFMASSSSGAAFAQMEVNQTNKNKYSETYQDIESNHIHLVTETPVSTFSVDVDTGGYSNIRRMLKEGVLPSRNHVRTEEIINYFSYDYLSPVSKTKPFTIDTATMPSPWNNNAQLLRIGLKGFAEKVEFLPASNIVFLVDVSGSMNQANKLPLVKQSLKLLTKKLRDDDSVAMVTYAGNTKVVLTSTSGKEKQKILSAIEQLNAEGSTAGESGLKLAYSEALSAFIKGGNNRIVMMTDGDFNVGLNSVEDMIELVVEKKQSGVFLSTIGFGQDNYREDLMEQMADHGNGVYFYIDSYKEAYRIFERNLRSSLFTIAKDVKVQVEFNPQRVKEYRLVGYENRLLKREDFNNDKVDAGDMGQGHSVTALYEISLVEDHGQIDPLRYAQQQNSIGAESQTNNGGSLNDELAFVKVRYKSIDSDQSELIVHSVIGNELSINTPSDDFKLAVSAASFGELLRKSSYINKQFSYQDLLVLLETIQQGDMEDVIELKTLVKLAASLN